MSGRDPIVTRAKVLRRIRTRRRATALVAAAALAAGSGIIGVAYALGGSKAAGFAFSLVAVGWVLCGIAGGVETPPGWWSDVFGLTDPDPDD